MDLRSRPWLVALVAGLLLVVVLPVTALALTHDGSTGTDHRPGTAVHGRGHGTGHGHGHRTEAQRAQHAQRMARLAEKHAVAMRRWADCLQAGRSDCERPLPPGLAKRR